MSRFIVQRKSQYDDLYKESVENPEKFWSDFAEDSFKWHRKWDKTLSYDLRKPTIKWFEGAQLNITENCIDRHLKTIGDQTAIIFEPNNPDEDAQQIT